MFLLEKLVTFFFCYVLSCVVSAQDDVFAPSVGSHVVTLTDSSFEHLTQASTGSTTGDWFVMFYAPWCGHCKNLHPTWEDLAHELKGEINVAQVDATEHKRTVGRFPEVKGYPTLLFFRNGSYYKYAGPRTLESLLEFVRDEYQRTPSAIVPAESRSLAMVAVERAKTFSSQQPLVAAGAALTAGLVMLGGIGLALRRRGGPRSTRKTR